MNKKKKKIIRWSVAGIALLLVVVAVVSSFVGGNVGASQFYVENSDLMAFNPFMSTENRLDNSLLEYGKVLSKYHDKGYKDYTGEPIKLDLQSTLEWGTENYVKFTDSPAYDAEVGGIKYYDNQTQKWVTVEGKDFPDAFYTTDDGTTINFVVDVTESGLYSLNMDYLILDAKDSEVYVSLLVDKKLPFKEASNMELKRMYNFYNTDLKNNTDVAGNQIRPKQQEFFGWQNTTMTNPEGVYRNPYKIYLKAGQHTLTMKFYNQPGVIGSVSLTAPRKSISYKEYCEAMGNKDSVYKGDSIRFELEVPDYTSGVSLRMEYDNDYSSSPASYETIRYNVFGGARWSSGGDSVQWTFNAPVTGWYQIGFRYQSLSTNVASYKEILFDGEILFEELEEYCFPYAEGWIGDCLKDANNKPYMIYFTAGEHTITLTNKLGPLRHTYQALDESIESISNMITQVAKITASSRSESGGYVVDKNRDWDLQKYLPDLQEDLSNYVSTFEKCYSDIKAANGNKLPSYGSAVKVAWELFEELEEDLEKVPTSLNDITDALTGLSNTMVAVKEQAITVDYMILSEKDYAYDEAYTSLFEDLYVGIIRFKDTFIKDYSAVGTRVDTNDDKDMMEIEVYVSRGREYVDIMRNLVAEQFTPEYGIKVNLNMVAGSSEGLIMQRYVAGTAPDAAISIGTGTPFEYAVRGALVPLNKFKTTTMNGNTVLGFDDLLAQSYYESAVTPFLYQGQYYGFPETQNWQALFYRTDIFEELNLEAPNTWEDVYNILPALTKDGYSFYFPYGVGNYTPFLYQHGGDFYDYDGLESALNTNAAYDAFNEYSDLFLQYNFIYAADFYMRFKSGEMPVGIGDLAFYGKLKYSAPELNGKWEILPVPGHFVLDDNGNVVLDEEGQPIVNRATNGVASCSIIINSGDEKREQATWAFLQWWASDSVQEEYGREVEATFGVASRWNPANKNAVATLPYTLDELDVIYEQWEWLQESPNVLGGYYTSRYLTTALNQHVLQGVNARVALEDAIKEINKEMLRKQTEYRIAEKGGSVLRESKSGK